MIGEVEGLQRHVLRLAQLLICICGGVARQEEIGRSEGPLSDQKRFESDGRRFRWFYISSLVCLVGKCEIAV